jgi:hypothetical protein
MELKYLYTFIQKELKTYTSVPLFKNFDLSKNLYLQKYSANKKIDLPLSSYIECVNKKIVTRDVNNNNVINLQYLYYPKILVGLFDFYKYPTLEKFSLKFYNSKNELRLDDLNSNKIIKEVNKSKQLFINNYYKN